MSVTWAHPWILFLAPLPLVWLILERLARQRDQSRWQRLGHRATLQRLVVGPKALSTIKLALLMLAWLAATLGAAGPRWGQSNDGVAVGRDIVLVMDFSRSMWADDMQSTTAHTRWQAEIAAARELVNRRRSGDRFAIVLFAARPYLLVPLTTDYDHLDLRLSRLDAKHPPAEIRPDRDDVRSGTRLGAALKTAVEQHDSRFPGYQEIVLFTDADDPAADSEWRTGVDAARSANIPVHVVGLGDPAKETRLTLNDTPVLTRLHEDVAKAIAIEGHGEYLAARTTIPPMSDFDRRVLQSAPHRELSDERRPQPRDRSAWLYGLAILFLLAACFWRETGV